MAEEQASQSENMGVDQAAQVFSGILAREKAQPATDAKPKANIQELKRAAAEKRAAEPEPKPEVEEPDNRPEPEAEVQIDDAGEETGSDNASAIEPPKSMPAELRAKFAELPVEYQEFLVARERDVANGGEKITGKAKTAEAEFKAATQRYEQATQQLQQQSRLHRHPDIVAFETEFKDILEGKTDTLKLIDEDFARHVRYNAMKDKATAAWHQTQAAEQEAARASQAALAKFREEQNEELKTLLPELKDAKKFTDFDNRVTRALRDCGLTDQQILGANAKGLALAYDGIRYRDAIVAAKKAETKPAPSVQKPGTAERRNGKAEAMTADLNRLRKSGSTDDAAKVFGRLLGG